MNQTTYLAHYGVPGMKWGVRKAESSKGSSFREKRALRKLAKAVNKVNKANAQLQSKTKFMTVEGSPNVTMVQNRKAAAKYNKAAAKYNRLMSKQLQKYGDVKIVNASKKV